MHTLIYDGSFSGFFTAVFEVFEYRYTAAEIIAQSNFSPAFFTETHEVITAGEKADRVLKYLEKQLGKKGVSQLVAVFLSDLDSREQLLLRVIRYATIHPGKNILKDYAHPDVIQLTKVAKSVFLEAHRMKGFVRFTKLSNEVFFAVIAPDYNILPLIKKHFEQRFQDQRWMIYDVKRQYGIMYDLTQADFVFPEESQPLMPNADSWHKDEKNYQKLWQNYFKRATIPDRKNTKLHLKFIPKRYWKYLTEKTG